VLSSGATRPIAGLLSLLGGRRSADVARPGAAVPLAEEPAFPTKALQKFLAVLSQHENPVLLDLGPVVGSNVTYFGEQLGCRLRVEDLYSHIEQHTRAGTLDQMPAQFEARLAEPPGTVDGILCWDVFDFLDRPSAQALATALTRLLKPEGVLLGFFSSSEGRDQVYTKFVVVDDTTLRYRTYPASRPRQRTLLNRDIIKLFDGLRVTESYLMKTHVREILLRKPTYLSG
jgi:hypothetical protein